MGVARASWSAAVLSFHYPQIRQPDLEPSDVAELADDRKGASPNLRESAKSADSSSSSSRERIRKGLRGDAELAEGKMERRNCPDQIDPQRSEKEESADFADGRRFFVSSPWQPHSRSRLNMRLEKMWVMERVLCRFRMPDGLSSYADACTGNFGAGTPAVAIPYESGIPTSVPFAETQPGRAESTFVRWKRGPKTRDGHSGDVG